VTWTAAISALAISAAGPALAETLRFPGEAELQARRTAAEDSLFLPNGPYAAGDIDGITAEGALEQTAWVVGDGSLTTMQILASLRDQLIDAGFSPIYECDTRDCGGFDFRYEIDLLPEPDMHVNLGDFRYLAAEGPKGDGYVSVVVSRSSNTGFVQITRIGPPDRTPGFTASTKTPAPTSPVVSGTSGPLVEQLETNGHATLLDLAFRPGSTELGAGEFASLDSLATYLKANPERRVTLVGHTDAEGSLQVNINVSRRRATAVMEHLVSVYGVDAAQLAADGVGFLAPRSSNLTPEGRTQNRRVEVVMTSTQ